jgi:hypothetical protein
MPKVTLTLADLEDRIGNPIIIWQGWDQTTKRQVLLTLEQLPLAAQTAVLAWVSARLSTP